MTRRIKAKNLKIVYVSRAKIAKNRKNNLLEPPISISQSSYQCLHAHEININGPCKIRYSPEPDRNKGGARLWIETYEAIELFSLDRLTRERKFIALV